MYFMNAELKRRRIFLQLNGVYRFLSGFLGELCARFEKCLPIILDWLGESKNFLWLASGFSR